MRKRLGAGRRLFSILLIGGWLVLLPSQNSLQALDTQHKKARELEKAERWYEACVLYDQILQQDRDQPRLREAFHRCLRRYRQIQRHEDDLLQEKADDLAPSEALAIYDQVLGLIRDYYVEESLTNIGRLYREGIHELRFALRNPAFVRRHLKRARQKDINFFKSKLEEWVHASVRSRADANRQIEELLAEALTRRIMPAGVLVLELICGASHSLDEYSFYLSPSRMITSQGREKQQTIGVEIRVQKRSLLIERVYQKSPAAEAGLRRGDRLVRIEGEWLDPLDPQGAMDQLLGDPDTLVELEVIPQGRTESRTLKVARRPFPLSSVEHRTIRRFGKYVGYLRVYDFHSSTVQEVKSALTDLQSMPLDGLILDLRSNPGGLVRSGIAVAEMFLPEGVIARVQGRNEDLTRVYRADNGDALLVNMVVLVDQSTASAAEIVVGALKDHRRATILGQTTYGKCSIQVPIPLKPVPGGLRLTVARFASPSEHSFDSSGIEPDQIIDDSRETAVIKAALRLLLREDVPMIK